MKQLLLAEGGLEAFRRRVNQLAPGECFHLDAWCSPKPLTLALELAGDSVKQLEWLYYGAEKVPTARFPPGLVALKVCFQQVSELDFVTAALEQCPELQDLVMYNCTKGDFKAFFTALGRSAVTSLDLSYCSVPKPKLLSYLRRNKLTSLALHMHNVAVLTQLMEVLRDCSRLKTLTLRHCRVTGRDFRDLPLSLTTLDIQTLEFGPGFDWSFLESSAVTDLELGYARGLDSKALCLALAARLERAPMERLAIHSRSALPSIRFDRIKSLYIDPEVRGELLEAVVAASIIPGNHLREMELLGHLGTICARLVPALRNPNCRLTKLTLYGDDKGAARRFRQWVRILALLQGQQVKRLGSPLHRLPVEMIRLVGRL